MSTRRDWGPTLLPKVTATVWQAAGEGQRSGGDEEISQWSLSLTNTHIHGASFPFRADGAQGGPAPAPGLLGDPPKSQTTTYLPHKLAFPVHTQVELRLLALDPDLTTEGICLPLGAGLRKAEGEQDTFFYQGQWLA